MINCVGLFACCVSLSSWVFSDDLLNTENIWVTIFSVSPKEIWLVPLQMHSSIVNLFHGGGRYILGHQGLMSLQNLRWKMLIFRNERTSTYLTEMVWDY